ncbi:hypothetical protein Ahy_B09g098836 isoform B [Arachis hypogaea]|uniref:Uncharacterized protein n=1 Tax=Arachis hypogaea TaxID=3818 RepID=A0A444XT30_ARAHY|nr:hypothetical protein Ahy_B09g098836 isoform B [Arachis hypogaea]
MPASRHHGKGFACNFQAPHSAFLSAKGQDVRKILKRKDSDTGEKGSLFVNLFFYTILYGFILLFSHKQKNYHAFIYIFL